MAVIQKYIEWKNNKIGLAENCIIGRSEINGFMDHRTGRIMSYGVLAVTVVCTIAFMLYMSIGKQARILA